MYSCRTLIGAGATSLLFCAASLFLLSVSVQADDVQPAQAKKLAVAKQLSVDYFFDQPEISEIKIENKQYHRVIMPDVPNGGNAGQPSLPAKGAQILIPFETEVSSIEIVPGEKILIGSDFIIEPVSLPVKLSAEPGTASPPIPDSVIYASDLPFPESRFENMGTQGFRGYQILILKLQPVEYIPKSGELYYYPHLKVIFNTYDTNKPSELFRGLPEDKTDVITRVDNPEEVVTYAAGGVRTDRSYELLIITTSSLVSSFQPLEDYHDNNGMPTEIRTTSDIGSSDPDDIRAYITSQYSSEGIQYVLIGADDDIIPAKDLYVEAWSGSEYVEYNMPADIYYSCLDGTYNYDGDSYWGEPTDGNGGGDVDLVAEVYVGRAAVGNTTEADRFVDKTLWYLSNQHTQILNVLMVGEYLGFGGVSDYAGDMMDQIVDGSSADGYTTVGIPSDIYNVDRLYERDWPNWPQSELVSRINGGLHIINHLGHGSQNSAMKLYDSDIMSQLTNNDLCFVYSQTCLAGHLDGTDCWAEYMNIKTDNGGFAIVMNARYGWGTHYSTDGPSQRFDREFWDAVFNPAEDKMELGRANQDSKEDNLYRINESCMRWCTYELNLFGDPSVAFKEPPLYIDLPNGAPEYLEPGVPTVITVQITNGSEEYVPGSGILHYRYDGGTYQTSSLTPAGGNLYEAVLPAASCNDTPEFYFSAQGNGGATVYNPAGAPGNTYTAIVGTLTIFLDDDFETNQGWTVSNSGGLTDGAWQRGIPVGGGDRGDPINDYDSDGLGYCYVTNNADGNSDVDDGYTWLISPTINLGSSNAEISYALWYTNHTGDGPNSDYFKTYVSNNNGETWVLAETIGPYTSSDWTEHSFTVGDFVAPTSQVKIRFEASDVNPQSIVEAGIDAVTLAWFECGQNFTGSIIGVVDDAATDIPIQGVTVEAIGSGVSNVTNTNGEYALENLTANTYSVSFSHVNYRDTTVNNVDVTEGNNTTLNVEMEELSQDIPTLSEWGMIIMGLLLLAVGTAAVIRRRKSAALSE